MNKEKSYTEKVKEAEEKKMPYCKTCGSQNVYGVSRVVGYFTKIDRWNKGKQAEFRDRQKGNYDVSGKYDDCFSLKKKKA